MKFDLQKTTWQKVIADVIVFFVSSDNWAAEIDEVDALYKGEIAAAFKHDNFQAKSGHIYTYPAGGKIAAKTLVFAGMGKRANMQVHSIFRSGAILSKYARATHKKNLALSLIGPIFASFAPNVITKSLVEGMELGAYQFTKYKSKKSENKGAADVTLLVVSDSFDQYSAGIAAGKIYAEATKLARDLINEPPSYTTPTYLAQQALSLVQEDRVSVEVLEANEVKKLGMHAFLSVAQGSDEPPKFIKLTYHGGKRKVVIAGKGITFDTGGLSLKDAKNMETMKLDMAGAAAILGVFKALPKIKPEVTVIGLIAACENMLGPEATKPGDIVTAFNGRTIEILNTDAEGRLTLADVLSYAVTQKPEAIVDLATLTGACIVALGEEIAGLFCNDVKLTQKLRSAGDTEGEKIWPLPLEEEYRDLIRSDIADLQNIGRNRYGGAVTAALFLEEFVGSVPWAHIDIAGPAFAEREVPGVPKGGTGFGVRLLLTWLQNL